MVILFGLKNHPYHLPLHFCHLTPAHITMPVSPCCHTSEVLRLSHFNSSRPFWSVSLSICRTALLALPKHSPVSRNSRPSLSGFSGSATSTVGASRMIMTRSEERRVGKE